MKKFNTVLNGYDKKEVNHFVGEVANEYESMLSKLKSKDQEILILKEQVNHYKELETAMNKAVFMAEDSSNQIKRVAREEAKSIVEDAKRNASFIVNDALLKAEKVEQDTDRLRRSLKIYKARIKQAIEEQLIIIDDVDKIEYKKDEYE